MDTTSSWMFLLSIAFPFLYLLLGESALSGTSPKAKALARTIAIGIEIVLLFVARPAISNIMELVGNPIILAMAMGDYNYSYSPNPDMDRRFRRRQIFTHGFTFMVIVILVILAIVRGT